MTRTLHIDLDLTVNDDAEDVHVADAVLNALFACEVDDLPGVVSIDGAEPIRR